MALHGNRTLSASDRHTQRMTLHQTEMDKVEAILTPEQKTKFEEICARREQRRDEHQGAEQAPHSSPPGVKP